MLTRFYLVTLVLGALALAIPAGAQSPLETAFTYQGVLKDGGAPVDGTNLVDIRASLWDSPIGGSQIGTTSYAYYVDFDRGRFTAQFDFGTAPFAGESRYLELAVRAPAGSGTYYVLSPRQPITPAPYALYALDSAGGGESLWDENGSNVYRSGGYVGIGTSTPAARLHLYGSAGWTVPQIVIEHPTLGKTALIQAADGFLARNYQATGGQIAFGLRNADDRHLLDISAAGKVGIGTAVPITTLHAQISDTSGSAVRIEEHLSANYWDLKATGSANSEGAYKFLIRDAYKNATRVTIDDTGRVGIGTSDPMVKLEVAGTTRTEVLEITGGADVAEPFEIYSDQPLQPGMVVCIDRERPGQLAICRAAYDTRVAGIISGAGGVKPGMLMGQTGTAADGTTPVALTGRVYCWADASAGAIQPGDLLTTSNTPGYAMKVADHERARGATIGKAMTPLEHGTGLVLVLISLQ